MTIDLDAIESRIIDVLANGNPDALNALGVSDAPALVTAAREVLAIHRPVYPFIQSRQDTPACDSCRTSYEGQWVEYPCPTARALGVSVSSRAGGDS